MTFKSIRTFAAALALAVTSAHAAVNLPAYNVDTSMTTVSGLSSGGFMANQLGIAYSSLFKGVGVFAAGPYMCAGHNNYTACMYNASISSTQLTTMQNSINSWSTSGAIDNKANVANQKVYLFIGTSDFTVGQNPVTALKTQYTNNGVAAANLEHVVRSGASHTFPTDFDSTGNNGCGSAASPYISNCSYDGAKAVLTKFYTRATMLRRSATTSSSTRPTSPATREWPPRAGPTCRPTARAARSARCMWPCTAASRAPTRSATSS
jgi:poly(3-hydroxybutyrate) depolymerase